MQYMDGINGWRGWQWLFLLEGIPSVVVGVLVLVLLDDGPQKAKWLTQEERDFVSRRVAEDNASKGDIAASTTSWGLQGLPRLGARAGVFLRRRGLLRGELLDADDHPGNWASTRRISSRSACSA